jgi:hypothetical protein
MRSAGKREGFSFAAMTCLPGLAAIRILAMRGFAVFVSHALSLLFRDFTINKPPFTAGNDC